MKSKPQSAKVLKEKGNKKKQGKPTPESPKAGKGTTDQTAKDDQESSKSLTPQQAYKKRRQKRRNKKKKGKGKASGGAQQSPGQAVSKGTTNVKGILKQGAKSETPSGKAKDQGKSDARTPKHSGKKGQHEKQQSQKTATPQKSVMPSQNATVTPKQSGMKKKSAASAKKNQAASDVSTPKQTGVGHKSVSDKKKSAKKDVKNKENKVKMGKVGDGNSLGGNTPRTQQKRKQGDGGGGQSAKKKKK